ncbi:MAG: hypothetical protein ACI8Y4_002463 [Candidatus Poriferisodalaceae bacterium]|jgi:hypothetical protein
MSQLAELTVPNQSVDADNVGTYLTELWSNFGKQVPAVLAEHSSPAGRELRSTRLPNAPRLASRGLPTQVSAPETIDPDVVDLLVAVTSSSMFLELVVRMEHTPAKAAAMAERLTRYPHAGHVRSPRTRKLGPGPFERTVKHDAVLSTDRQ